MSVYKEFSRDLSLSGKVAVVSGGTSGIGFATAKMLALKGAAVVIWGRNPNIRQMAREIGGDAYGVQVDITDTAQILSAVDDVIKMNGKIDILCNSAGMRLWQTG